MAGELHRASFLEVLRSKLRKAPSTHVIDSDIRASIP